MVTHRSVPAWRTPGMGFRLWGHTESHLTEATWQQQQQTTLQLLSQFYRYINYCMLVTQLCLTLCNRMDWGPPGSSVLGIFQARILEWVAIPFSRGSSQARD